MLELRILNGAGEPVPLLRLSRMLGRERAAEEVGETIENLIDYLDALEGDVDLEEDDPIEPDGTEMGDIAWCETGGNWGAKQPDVMLVGQWHEDAEEDDHSGTHADEDDPSGWSQSPWEQGPGCPIADPGGGFVTV